MEFKILTDSNEEIRELRYQAFVVEKNVPKNIEFDGKDSEYIHFCLYNDDALVGCARGNKNGDALHIGRVAVRTDLRGRGYGKQLFKEIESFAKRMGLFRLELGAIASAVDFYKKIGFFTVGDFYDEAGWPHINMIKETTDND